MANVYHADCHCDLRCRTVEVDKIIDYCLCSQRADGGSETVCHDDKQSLCAGADSFIGLPVYKQGTGNVEEIECDSVDSHGEHEHPYTAAGVSATEEGKAEHPCQHGNQHHLFDAETFQEEWYQQDAERLGYLR